MLIVTMLALVLVASVPALTQTAPTNDIDASPVQETEAVQYAEDTSFDPAAALVPATAPEPAPASTTTDTAPAPALGGATVGCGTLYNDPAATCVVDENGFIELPDGSTAPVLVRPDGTAFVQDASGGLTLIGEGASFITGEGTTQDTAAQEQPPAVEPVESVTKPVEAVAEPVEPVL
jgi:hypothetical protein